MISRGDHCGIFFYSESLIALTIDPSPPELALKSEASNLQVLGRLMVINSEVVDNMYSNMLALCLHIQVDRLLSYLWIIQRPASNNRPEPISCLILASHHCSLCPVIEDPCERGMLSGSRHMRRQHIYTHLIPRAESAIFLTMASYSIPFDHILLECQFLS